MNPIQITSEVIEAKRLIELHHKDFPAEDYTAALIYLEAIRFHISRGDQTRAEVEYKNSMNFVNALILSQSNTGISCYKLKHFIKLWALSKRKEFPQLFLRHKCIFNAGMVKNDWIADLEIIRGRKSKYGLQVLAENDDDAIVVTTTDDMDKAVLFKEIAINPSLNWLALTINRALASLCLHHSVVLNGKRKK